MVDISEKNFESIIECVLLAGGPDAKIWVTARPFGFRKTQRVWIVACRRDEKRKSPFTKRKSRRCRR